MSSTSKCSAGACADPVVACHSVVTVDRHPDMMDTLKTAGAEPLPEVSSVEKGWRP